MAPTTTVQRRLDWRGPVVGLGFIILFALLPTMATALDWERRLFFAVHGICAQSHNLISGGVQFPLCARDSGIYLGLMVTLGMMAALGRMRAGRLPPLPIGLTLIGLMAVMGIDGLNSTVAELGFAPAYPPRDDLRLVTGLGFGAALAVGLLLVANHTFLPPDLLAAEQAPIGSWRDLGIVIGALGLVVAAIAANQAVLVMAAGLVERDWGDGGDDLCRGAADQRNCWFGRAGAACTAIGLAGDSWVSGGVAVVGRASALENRFRGIRLAAAAIDSRVDLW